MRRILLAAVYLGMIASVSYKLSGRHMMAAQASGQFTVQPQMYAQATTNIGVGVPVISVACGQTRECVSPATGTGGIAGITITSGAQYDTIYIAQLGGVECVFDNQPVQNDNATVVAGACHDDTRTIQQVLNTQGFVGRVLTDMTAQGCPGGATYCAYVNIIHPGALGGSVTSASFDSTVPAYIKANQSTSAGPTGPQGNPGTATTITIGTTTTGSAGSNAAVTNSGTSNAAVLNFTLPQGAAGVTGGIGQTGAAGAAATVAVGTVTSLTAGASPTVSNSGSSSAAVLNFGIPAGATGQTGAVGASGASGANAANPAFTASATALAAGAAPTVTLSGTYPALNLAYGIPAAYLKGTTGTITGTLLAVGGYDSGTASITGATPGMGCLANTTDGSEVSTSVTVKCDVTSAGVATVKVIAFVIGTPASKAFNVKVFP